MGRPVYELEEEMPLMEVLEWRAFWRLKHAAEKKALEKAKEEAKREAAASRMSRRRR